MNVNNSLSNMYGSYTKLGYESIMSSWCESGEERFTAFNLEITKFEFNFQSASYGWSQGQEKVKTLSDYIDYDAIGYTGKPIEELTQDEAKELVSKDGFFGVDKTSQRLADFVIIGAGDDLEKLKEGREGIIQGFKEAEQIWGEKLYDISYETLDKALAMIDDRIKELGGSVLDVEV